MFTDVFLDVAGGIRTSIESQRADLERLGHTVYVFCPGRRPSADPHLRIVPTNRLLSAPGIPIAKWPKRVIPFIRTELKKLDIDIVHVHYELSTSISALKVARELDLPIVQTMHGREDVAIEKNLWPGINTIASWILCRVHAHLIPHSIKIKRDHHLARTHTARNMWEIMVNHANFADYVIFPSHHFQTKFLHYGLKKPTQVISNGLSDKVLEDIGKVSIRSSQKGSPLKIIWFSRMSHEKRPLEFLEAVLASQIPIELNMYGDGNLEERTRWYASRFKMHGVKIHGFASHHTVLDKIRSSDIAILNSYGFDNQPMTLLEAIATGLPTIIVDPDMKEVLPSGGYILVKSSSVSDMANALRDLSAHPEKIEQMSKIVIENRSIAFQSSQTSKLLTVYHKLVKL